MPAWVRAVSWSIHLGLATYAGMVQAQSLYKYRDTSGVWVYTDRQPPPGTKAETMTVDLDAKAPRITVEQSVDGPQLRLLAINDCGCAAEYSLQINSAGNVSVPERIDGETAATYHAALQPHSRLALPASCIKNGSATLWSRYF